MKLGVSYNLFDGEELLESSIKSIRDSVDYISVVYQTVSNFGNPCDEGLEPLLEKLMSEGLIDETFLYKPNKNGGHQNEITKRNIGLSLSEGAKCTHHMSMDSDEYYVKEQLDDLKRRMVDGDFNSSYCKMRTYFKDPTFEIRPMNEYYVSVIFKISPNNEFVIMQQSPVMLDPTRRMKAGIPLILEREDMEMYHMSYVRKNIKTKLENSSAKSAFKDVDGFLKMFNNYQLGEIFFTTNGPGNETTILVDNKFNIEI